MVILYLKLQTFQEIGYQLTLSLGDFRRNRLLCNSYNIDIAGHNCFGNSPGPATVHLIHTIENGSIPLKNCLFQYKSKMSMKTFLMIPRNR